MKLKSKLNRLKKHMVKEENEKKSEVEDSVQHVTNIPFMDDWLKLQASPYYFEGEYCIVRQVEYPLSYQHGTYQLKEFEEVVQAWNDVNLDHPLSAKDHQPFDLFFFDTETTGLKGGTGNMIFLLGHARFHDDKVVIKQHFLPSPGHEVALYKSFLSEVNIQTLVTYNGKAFDWPRVKTRHTFIRHQVPKLPSFGHFDLYHASRRLWRDQFESVRLSIVEKEILDIKRTDETPGYLAPMIYFHFLQNPNPHVIQGIFKHNERDILSLITLYIHISKILLNASNHQNESFQVAKWYKEIGNEKEAIKLFETMTKYNNETNDFEAKFELSMLQKKDGNLASALKLWNELKNGPINVQKLNILIELAKHYEHMEKNYYLALEETNEAMNLLDQLDISKEKLNKYKVDLTKRKNRLIQKLSKLTQH